MTLQSERIESFEVIDGHLVRKVVPVRGEPYEHRCPRASFEQIAHAIDEIGRGPLHAPMATDGFTLETLAEHEGLPSTQVAVALAFLKERGIVETRYRRNYAATSSAHLDAMTEYFALAKKG